MTVFFSALNPIIFSLGSIVIGVVVFYMRAKGGYL